MQLKINTQNQAMIPNLHRMNKHDQWQLPTSKTVGTAAVTDVLEFRLKGQKCHSKQL